MERGEYIYRTFVTTVVLFVIVCGSTSLWACDVPVYRYAMYNWSPALYRVFYLYDGEMAERDVNVNKMLGELGSQVNVAFYAIDVSKKEQFEQLDAKVKKAWGAHDGAIHLVFSPWGVKLFAGRLDEAEAKAMIDSPARTKLGKMFDEGCGAVFLMIDGADANENRRAKDLLKETIDLAPEATIKVGLVTVSRDDRAERWLVRLLTSVESDLVELKKQPMVFPVFGRGRTMLPFIGKGVSQDNMEGVVRFLIGDCSCTIKTGNPGADLLLHQDWDLTIAAMQKSEPAADEQLAYEEFMPPVGDTVAEETIESEPTSEPPPSNTSESFAASQMWKLGIGLGLAAVVVAVIGFVFMRRRLGI